MAISFLFFTFLEYFFNPASANAPAGSERTLVSSKISFTAVQTSSTLTVMTSSTHSLITSKLFFPTVDTATPSAKSPTSFNVTLLLALTASARHAESSTSTPIIFVFLLFCDIQAETPAKIPPPPTGTKTTSKLLSSSRISLPIVPCPAIVNGSSKG